MVRPSIETAREWAPKAIRDRLPGGHSRTGLLDAPKAAMRRRRRRWMRARRRRTAGGLGMRGAALRERMPSMPRPPSVSMPSPPSLSMPSMPSMPTMSKPSRRRRRRSRRMAGNLGVMVGAGAGYVLGTKAGRERYRQIVEQARQLWQRPQVQDTVAKGRDRVGSGVARAAATAGDRLHQARERASGPAPSTNGPARSTTSTGPTGAGGQGGPTSPGGPGSAA